MRSQRVALFYLTSIHQISTLEKTKFYQHSILSSLMSTRIQRISPFNNAAQFAGSVEIDLHVWFSWRPPRQASTLIHLQQHATHAGTSSRTINTKARKQTSAHSLDSLAPKLGGPRRREPTSSCSRSFLVAVWDLSSLAI